MSNRNFSKIKYHKSINIRNKIAIKTKYLNKLIFLKIKTKKLLPNIIKNYKRPLLNKPKQ